MKLAPVAEKIGKILPRLASNHSGEVVASVEAVRRLLQSVGADWHDFTRAFEQGANGAVAKASRPPPRGPVFPQWESLTHRERAAWVDALNAAYWLQSPWEQNFLASISPRVHNYDDLSEKQIAVLDRLLRRAYARGVRPEDD